MTVLTGLVRWPFDAAVFGWRWFTRYRRPDPQEFIPIWFKDP